MKRNKKNILFLGLWIILLLAFCSLLVVSSIYFTHYSFALKNQEYWLKFGCLICLVVSSIVIFIMILLILKFFYEIIFKIKKRQQNQKILELN